MKIEKLLYGWISDCWAFSKMFVGPNYFPFIRGYRFVYSGDLNFSINNLEELIRVQPLTGIIKECSFEDIKESINNAVKWDVNPQGVLSKVLNQKLIEARTFMFFDNIKPEFINDNVKKCFIYQQVPHDYFFDTTLWSFCFVLLSEKEGLVFYGKTWTNSQKCKPEVEAEYNWRKNHRML